MPLMVGFPPHKPGTMVILSKRLSIQKLFLVKLRKIKIKISLDYRSEL